MIYLVTKQTHLFELPDIQIISPEESLKMASQWEVIQYDSETSGRDAHLCDLLCIQLGDKQGNNQIVVDASTIDVRLYKELLETHMLLGHNLKFDLQFLYNYDIIPRRVYDTMIVEQLLYLGYPNSVIKYSLKEVAWRRLNIDIDKTVRGEIIWRGLDCQVIKYAAGDVQYLGAIMDSQWKDCQKKECTVGAKLECLVVPAIAYMEWCGVLLDADKWKAKMADDQKALIKATENLNKFVTSNSAYKKFTYINTQGDLFDGFDLTPKCTINWDSPKQVTEFFKFLGFNTNVQDKKTGEDKDSVLEKVLKQQKGINDEFLKIYFDYKEHSKVCSTYGQSHLNMINPKTGRIHTVFKQLGAQSGRMSCGSTQSNTDLAKAKNLPAKECTYANLQQLPADEPTRGAFVAPKGYKFVSADFSAEEARLGGDIYQDEAILDIFRKGLDSHSVYAKAFFTELKDVDVNEIKSKYKELRQLAKGPEFALSFGGGYPAIMSALQCSREKAEEIIRNYENTFKGTAEYARKGEKKLMQTGYVNICLKTGHKLYWWDFDEWKERQASYDTKFWEEYREVHKPAKDYVYQEVKTHFKAKSKWCRMVRNACTQGTGSIIMKTALTKLFNWIVDNNYFNIVHICVSVHDEICCDYPEQLEQFPKVLTDIMEESASEFCKSIPIPANAEVSDHWVH